MKDNLFLTNYKNLSEEELKKLPVEELAKIAHEALKNWDRLNQRVNQDSTNSSRAPSTDSPEARAKRQAEEKAAPSKRKPRKQGAQPGHKAVKLPLVELGANDTFTDCKPQTCVHCGESLADCIDPAPWRRQIYEVEIIRRVTEYRKHRCICPKCGQSTEGALPPEATGSAYGPNLVLLTGMLTGLCQVSRRMARVFIENLTDIPISVGSLSNLERELTEACAPVVEEIEAAAQNASQGNADETGFGLRNGLAGWLWVLVTPFAVLFRVFEGRGSKYATQLLGKFEGILTSDRWGGYNNYPQERRQLCWAHLIRDFRSMEESGPEGEAVGRALRKETRELFRMWHRFRKWKKRRESQGASVSMEGFAEQVEPLRCRVRALLEEGARRKVPKCKPILKVESLLWTFAKNANIEPTNNAAERAIRRAVLWKKRSFGVESARGARYVEAMLSLPATCRCNGISPASFLRDLLHSYRSKKPAPSIFDFQPYLRA